VIFNRFSAELSEPLKKDLDIIAGIVVNKPNRIDVRGHASPEPLPPDSSYRDPLDLSFARAHAVANYLIGKGIDPHRIRVSAAGNSEPRTLARGHDAQAINRRVDVFLIDSYIAAPGAPRVER
jgi:chemotaxis protein MotB